MEIHLRTIGCHYSITLYMPPDTSERTMP